MKEQLAPVFEFPVRVYWEDTDAGGIVFYANYLKYFERARTEWLRSLGLQQHTLKAQLGGMFVVTEAQLRYHLPARLDDLLCVTARLQRAGRSQCELHQQVWLQPPAPPEQPRQWPPSAGTSAATPPSVKHSAAGPRLLCEGQVNVAWVDAQHLRPQRMPLSLLHALQGTDADHASAATSIRPPAQHPISPPTPTPPSP